MKPEPSFFTGPATLRALFLLPAAAALHALQPATSLLAGLASVAFLCQLPILARKTLRHRHAPWLAAKLSIAIATALFLSAFWIPGLPAFWPSGTVCLIALSSIGLALLPDKLGLGRLIIVASALATLLLARGLADSTLTTFAWPPIAAALAFASALEIARSGRYREPLNTLGAEFIAAVVLAALAASASRSLPLAFILAAIPTLAFALRNHARSLDTSAFPFAERLEVSNASAKQRSFLPFAAAASLALASACIGYVLLLKTPFWANLVRQAPASLASLAYDAEQIASRSTLEPASLRQSVEDFDAQAALSRISNSIETAFAQASESFPQPRRSPQPDDDPETEATTDADTPSEPTFRSRGRAIGERLFTLLPESPTWEVRQHPDSVDSWRRPRRDLNISAPSRGLQMQPPLAHHSAKENAEEESISFEGASPSGSSGPLGAATASYSRAGLPPQNLTTLAAPPALPQNTYTAPTPMVPVSDFDGQFSHSAYGSYLQLGNEALAPIGQEAILIARIDPSHDAPDRLYLRSSHMDTIRPDGISAPSGLPLPTTAPLIDGRLDADPAFQTSSRDTAKATIVAKPARLRQLPVAESFLALRIPDAQSVSYHASERIVANPLENSIFTYQILGADFDPSAQHRRAERLSESELQRLLDLPLSRAELRKLKRYASRIGGRRPNRAQFASRAAEYFKWKHPYSLEAIVPPGSQHPALRWLDAESSGICIHYATAYVMLARSLGIPARVVAGYSTDEYDSSHGVYVARDAHAHAWAEYLDESNRWIRIDPTPAITGSALREQAARVEPRRPIDDLVAHQFGSSAESSALANTTRDSLDSATLLQTLENRHDSVTAADSSQPSEADTTLQDLLDHVELNHPADSLAGQPLDTPNDPTTLTQRHATLPEASFPSTQTEQVPVPLLQNSLSEQLDLASQLALTPPFDSEAGKPQPSADAAAAPSTTETSAAKIWAYVLLTLAAIAAAVLLLPKARVRGMPILALHAKAQSRRIRAEAGKLLQRVESAIAQRRLQDHELWRELRLSLQALRYGPRADALQLKSLKRRTELLNRAHFNNWK